MIAIWGLLRGPAREALGLMPRPIWYIFAGVVALALAWHWHGRKVDLAYASGARVQADADGQRFDAAGLAAAAAQNALVATLAARQSRISKGTDDALLVRNADLARRYDDLRLRWTARRTDPRGPGQNGAIAVPGAAVIADDAACAASGWVSFDTAAAAAEAADTAIAKDDAWRAWAAAQTAAWPGR